MLRIRPLFSSRLLCGVCLPVLLVCFAGARGTAWSADEGPVLSAKSALVMDPRNGQVLYSKNPHLKLPPASTAKMMTALLAFEHLRLRQPVPVSRFAASVTPSKAGLVPGVRYRAVDLIVACLVSSSNDAAVAVAEAVAGSEAAFAELMNEKARRLGMKNTRFVNATGLPDPDEREQYSTAHDLTILMRHAAKDRRIDKILEMTSYRMRGSDGVLLKLTSHNKMLWRTPKFVKGKTGWTFASRHTFVGMNYEPKKRIVFAMLKSKKPWTDIENLANHGLRSLRRS